MKDGLKIATIGGGSSYTPELIQGFITRFKDLPVRELWLVDIPDGEEKQNITGAMAKRMVKAAGVPIDIHLTLNREEALKDADFVTTQFRVGLLPARAKDERIPLKYDSIGQETNGAGGLFKGLRTIPVILEIIEDMKRLCPDAWLINFTNPSGMVTQAAMKYGNWRKVIGLCNGPFMIKRGIAETLGVDDSEIYVEFTGLNHMIFAKHVYYKGEDVIAKVIDTMMKSDVNKVSLKNIADYAYEPEFFKRLNMIPIGYLRYYWMTSRMLKDAKRAANEEGTRAEVVMKVEAELMELYKDPNLVTKPQLLSERGGAYYSEAACNLIDSIYNDKRDIQTVNTRNNGAILDLDPDAAVEVNCVITKRGPLPITTGPLPVEIKGLVNEILSFNRVAGEAAVTGDYDTALLAMTINPLIPSDIQAKEIMDDMLQAHKKYLPNFFKDEVKSTD